MGKLSKTIGGGMFVMGNIVSPILTYKDSRNQGDSKAVALAKTAATEAFYMTPFGGMAMVGMLGKAGIDIASSVGTINGQASYRAHKSQFGGNYYSSQNGQNMRQRGLNAINNQIQNNNQVLGSEARSYHRGWFTE